MSATATEVSNEATMAQLITPKNLVRKYPNNFSGVSEQEKLRQITWEIFQRKRNGLAMAGAIFGTKHHRRLHEERYIDWQMRREHFEQKAKEEFMS